MNFCCLLKNNQTTPCLKKVIFRSPELHTHTSDQSSSPWRPVSFYIRDSDSCRAPITTHNLLLNSGFSHNIYYTRHKQLPILKRCTSLNPTWLKNSEKNASNKISNFGCCGACICFGGNEVLKPFNALSFFCQIKFKIHINERLFNR